MAMQPLVHPSTWDDAAHHVLKAACWLDGPIFFEACETLPCPCKTNQPTTPSAQEQMGGAGEGFL